MASALSSMSARLTVIFFILICLEIGALLVFLPWHPSWKDNHLLILVAEKLHWPSLVPTMMSGYVRGAVCGLGLLNIILGGWEIINFRKTVRAFQSEWQGEDPAGLPGDRPAEARGEDR